MSSSTKGQGPSDDPVARLAQRLSQGRNAPRAGRALGALGPVSVPSLLQALGHANPFVRSGAVIGLEAAAEAGASKPEVAARVVEALSQDADGRVRETACAVLGRLGSDAVALARDALTRATTDPDERVRAAALKALGS